MSTEHSESYRGPLQFTSEQETVLTEVNQILDMYTKKMNKNQVSSDDFNERQKTIINFGTTLKEKDFNPIGYILWHRLIGGSLDKRLDNIIVGFDTPNHDIERFIKEDLVQK